MIRTGPLCFLNLVLWGWGCHSPFSEPMGACWGQELSSEKCTLAQTAVDAALGLSPSLLRSAEGAACGPVVSCVPEAGASDGRSEALPSRSTPGTESLITASGEVVTPHREETLGEDGDGATDGALGATEGPRKNVVLDTFISSQSRCSGMNLPGLFQKSSLSTPEADCLMAVARGEEGGGSDVASQNAAISLYNARAPHWEEAVEAALAHGNSGAPRLNLAGIKRAYNRGEHAVVLTRASRAWNGASSGYLLADGEALFVAEHACRAAWQLHRSGKSPPQGVEWCERWKERGRRAGADIGVVEGILAEME